MTEEQAKDGQRIKEQFHKELCELLNRYSKENGSNTPDYALATFLEVCLIAFDAGVEIRESYYGRPSKRLLEMRELEARK